jgi:hypothetical protein
MKHSAVFTRFAGPMDHILSVPKTEVLRREADIANR